MELDEGKDSQCPRTHSDMGGEVKRSLECRRHSGDAAAEMELGLTLWFHPERMRGEEGNSEEGR